MPIIEFQPSGATIECEEQTEILDAARKAGVIITAPCGGKGTCGKCAVSVVKGEIAAVSAPDGKQVLACKSRVQSSNVIIEIPPQDLAGFDRYEDDLEYFSFIRSTIADEKNILPIAKVAVHVPEMSPGLLRSDIDRLLDELSRQDCFPGFSLNIVRELPHKLRANSGTLFVWLRQDKEHQVIVHVDSEQGSCYGLAIDIGTTTIAVQLYDLERKEIIATRSAYNDQLNCGLDVISRINYARTEERLNDMQGRALYTLNRLIDAIIEDKKIATGKILSVVVSGNTVMTHLLTGIQPEYIRLSPYTPAIMNMPLLTAKDLLFHINPDAGVYISPAVGSYVGGDITAGIVCSGLVYDHDGISLYLDIGTNGELVVGNAEFLLTCACSAGPAFEGGNISCGMRATAGAINKVTIDQESGKPTYSTIDDMPARGICGSGLLDVLAELLRTGWLDAFGKLNRDKKSAWVIQQDKKFYYYFDLVDKTVYISETDIENVMRAKAAIYSACSLMLEQVGVGFDELTNIYLAGGFGKYVNIENAITLGLLPDVPRQKYVYLGNASLKGSALILLSEKYKNMQQIIAEKMTYIDLSVEPCYMDQYTAALFFPHTDFSQFPSVNKKD